MGETIMVLVTSSNIEEVSPISVSTSINNIEDKQEVTSSLPVKKLSTSEAIKETRFYHSVQVWKSFFEEEITPLLYYGKQNKVPMMRPEIFGAANEWFIIGDIHGDYFALRNAVEHIKTLCPNFGLIFLGDLVDRGPHPMECLWYLLNLSLEHPNRILWIAGNHDIGVYYDEQSNQFKSTVYPSEFLNHLNHIDCWTPFHKNFGLAFIKLVSNLPRAVLLPDGTLITHGGFPLVDLQNQLPLEEDKKAWINTPNALQDFTWTRISRYKMKLPNRSSTGCSYGFDDFAKFCETTKSFFPTSRLVTGHNHPEDGYDKHVNWINHPALTLTGYGFSDAYQNPEAYNSLYRNNLIIGNCRENAIPEVIDLQVNKLDLEEYYHNEIIPYFSNNTDFKEKLV